MYNYFTLHFSIKLFPTKGSKQSGIKQFSRSQQQDGGSPLYFSLIKKKESSETNTFANQHFR